MACSEAKLAANRRNAQLSTGPKTPEGKDKSRANALTHGLCSKLLIPEDADVIEARINQVFSALKPQNEFQAWLVYHVAVCNFRIDRCERIERRTRNKICLRAELTWDEDRKLEAEKLDGMLSKRPAEIVDTLRRTPHGCDWLITRWATSPRGRRGVKKKRLWPLIYCRRPAFFATGFCRAWWWIPRETSWSRPSYRRRWLAGWSPS